LYAFLFITIMSKLRSRWVTWGILFATLAFASLVLHAFYPFSISLFGREYKLYGLPLSLDLIFLNGFFFILGSEARQQTSERAYDNIFLLIGTGIGLIVLNYLFSYEVDIALRVYDSFLVNTAEALLGIFFVLALSRQIELHAPRLTTLFKYVGNISLIILIFHLPIQRFWGEKVMDLTNNIPLGILIGFVMGVLGPALIYEIFIRYNPVASFWFGRKGEVPEQQELPARNEQAAEPSVHTPVVEVKEQ
jgi:fucose 4-O-acetylase-like acetyltransferase